MDVTGQIGALTRPDGYELHYRRWPVVGPARTTAIFFNGIMGHSGWFSALAPGLGAAGIHMVGADRRGSGPNSVARGDGPDAATLLADAQAVVDAEHDAARRLVLVGWCWGASLAVHLAVSLGARLAGLVLVTPGFFPSDEVRTLAREGLAQAQGRPLDQPSVPTPIREALFTDGPVLHDYLLHDADRLQVMTPRMATLAGKLVATAPARLARLPVPCLLVLAEQDEATDNGATVQAFERSPAGPRQLLRLPTHHGIVFEAPQALGAAITGFVAAL